MDILAFSFSKFIASLPLELIRFKYVCIEAFIMFAKAYIATPVTTGATTVPTGLADNSLPTPVPKLLTVLINCIANGLSSRFIAAFCKDIFALSSALPTLFNLIMASRRTEPAALLAVSSKFSPSLFNALKRAKTRDAFLVSTNSPIAATLAVGDLNPSKALATARNLCSGSSSCRILGSILFRNFSNLGRYKEVVMVFREVPITEADSRVSCLREEAILTKPSKDPPSTENAEPPRLIISNISLDSTAYSLEN